jgi:chaperonin cofactor prefoldin
MAEYCEDLADSFERLESQFKALAKQYRQAKQRRLAEICEQLADEHDRVADRLNELQKAYEKLEKELKR